MMKNVEEEKLSHSCCINGLIARAENYPLCKPMVDHDHN